MLMYYGVSRKPRAVSQWYLPYNTELSFGILIFEVPRDFQMSHGSFGMTSSHGRHLTRNYDSQGFLGDTIGERRSNIHVLIPDTEDLQIDVELTSIPEYLPSGVKIWWLCLVPTSTTRFASDVGYRMDKKLIRLYKENNFHEQCHLIP